MAVRVSDEDITTLNFLQAISADENLYFSDWSKLAHVKSIVRKAKRYRRISSLRLDKFEEVGSQQSILFQAYKQLPNLRLRLSFMTIIERARKVSTERMLTPEYRYRNVPKDPEEKLNKSQEASKLSTMSTFKRSKRNK